MNQKMAIVVVIAMIGVLSTLQAQPPQTDGDIRLNVIVSSTGNLRNDGKGTYSQAKTTSQGGSIQHAGLTCRSTSV
jgi:hypothetical protein